MRGVCRGVNNGKIIEPGPPPPGGSGGGGGAGAVVGGVLGALVLVGVVVAVVVVRKRKGGGGGGGKANGDVPMTSIGMQKNDARSASQSVGLLPPTASDTDIYSSAADDTYATAGGLGAAGLREPLYNDTQDSRLGDYSTAADATYAVHGDGDDTYSAPVDAYQSRKDLDMYEAPQDSGAGGAADLYTTPQGAGGAGGEDMYTLPQAQGGDAQGYSAPQEVGGAAASNHISHYATAGELK